MTDVQDAMAHADDSNNRTAATIRAWLLAKCAEVLDVPVESLDPFEPLNSYGIGSVQAVSLVGDLEEWLGRQLPATLLWDYPTLDAVASALEKPGDDSA